MVQLPDYTNHAVNRLRQWFKWLIEMLFYCFDNSYTERDLKHYSSRFFCPFQMGLKSELIDKVMFSMLIFCVCYCEAMEITCCAFLIWKFFIHIIFRIFEFSNKMLFPQQHSRSKIQNFKLN